MPDDVVIDGRPDLMRESFERVAEAGFEAGQQTERVRCLGILNRVLKERPPSVPEALLRVGELIDAGN
jgi:hypothetical protein